jgi:hypothetical protein
MPAGDFHLTIAQSDTKPEKTLVERWQTWVALFVGVLTITTLAADLPGRIRKIFAPDESTIQVMQQPLSGVIWDQGHEPLTGVGVVLPEFNLATTNCASVIRAHDMKNLFGDVNPEYTHLRHRTRLLS